MCAISFETKIMGGLLTLNIVQSKCFLFFLIEWIFYELATEKQKLNIFIFVPFYLTIDPKQNDVGGVQMIGQLGKKKKSRWKPWNSKTDRIHS